MGDNSAQPAGARVMKMTSAIFILASLTSQTKQGLPTSASTAPAGRSPGKASAREYICHQHQRGPSSMLTGSTLR